LINEVGVSLEKNKNKKLEGLVFTLTGAGPIKRPEIQRLIEENGGEVKNISKNVNYLVVADIDTQSTKAKKARKYKIDIITYDDLFEKFL
jgi:NAD-dependent DNA ligase